MRQDDGRKNGRHATRRNALIGAAAVGGLTLAAFLLTGDPFLAVYAMAVVGTLATLAVLLALLLRPVRRA